jgi:hypothetical protein
MSQGQYTKLESIVVRVHNPTNEFTKELERAHDLREFMYLDRFFYGIPEHITYEGDEITVLLLPKSDLLDPWVVTQDIKDEMQELDDFLEGGFSDDPLE